MGEAATAVEAPAGSSEPPLRVERLKKYYGGIAAVDGASFSVEAGSLTGLIGPNGAGKSTTFDLITGAQRPDDGTVSFRGEDITGLRPYEIARRGLVRTFQITRELPEMTVLENVMLAPKGQSGETLWRSVVPGAREGVVAEERTLRERAWETVEFFELDHLATEHAGNLSGGQRKLLEMARAMMAQPRLIMLDEPMAGVNPALTQSLLGHVKRLRSEGISVMFVEHDMDVVQDISDWVVVMAEGSVIAEGPPRSIGENPAVVDAYLGSSHAALTEEIREAVAGDGAHVPDAAEGDGDE